MDGKRGEPPPSPVVKCLLHSGCFNHGSFSSFSSSSPWICGPGVNNKCIKKNPIDSPNGELNELMKEKIQHLRFQQIQVAIVGSGDQDADPGVGQAAQGVAGQRVQQDMPQRPGGSVEVVR